MYSSVDDWQQETNSKSRLLHLGCGSKYWQGWCNIDAYPSEETDTHRGMVGTIYPDIWSDIKSIPASYDSIDGIASHHVLEHFYRHETISLANYFYKLLKPGGFFVTEMPDLSRVLFLLHWLPKKPNYPDHMKTNRNQILAQLYGASWESNDKGYPYHKYLWERSEFCEMLREIGFKIVLETGSTLSHKPFRDMAIIAQKPYHDQSYSNFSADDSCKIYYSRYGNPFTRFTRQMRSLITIFKDSLY